MPSRAPGRSPIAEKRIVSESAWQVFDLQQLSAGMTGASAEYQEFLRAQRLSCGLYTLKAGARDMQTPHDEDEVYYVISGRATMKIGDVTRSVGPGNVLFVRAAEAHTFFEIEEDMTLLVFFAAAL
jgi:mannose-6-phosphate isomerase-like protein (cupin superfamily)